MKAIEQYFHVIPFIMLYKVVLTFKSVYKTLLCDYSNENYSAVLFCGTVYYAVHGGSTFKSVSKSLVCDHSNESYRVEVLSGTSTSTSQSDHSNETFIRLMRQCLKELRAVLLCSYVYRTFKFRDYPRDCLENRVLCVIFP